jgi:hypothetical protein
VLERIRPQIRRATPLSEERYSLELPLSTRPERLLADVVASGASLASLNPLRETLEEFFVKQVQTAGADRGLGV